jgi:hypothetical protein
MFTRLETVDGTGTRRGKSAMGAQTKKATPQDGPLGLKFGTPFQVPPDQWNCSSSVDPVRALTLDEPPWITVVTSSK